MIEDFLSTWKLFQLSFLTGWLAAFLLALVGVVVVARDQIFLGAAISQASTLGIAVALALGSLGVTQGIDWLSESWLAPTLAVVFSLLAALVTGGIRDFRESREAIAGWVFLVAASLSVLLVAHSPHGLEEVHELLFSSIIAVTATDLWIFVIMASLAVATLIRGRRQILLVAIDAPVARAIGIRTGAWQIGISLCLGLVVGFSIRAAGLLYTFGCLVLPALIAKNCVRELTQMLVVAPVISVLVAVAGFVLAHHYDFPVAQMTVALLSGLLALAWLWRWVSRPK